MNKSRRMVTLLAERLCASGVGTFVFDLYGTGDSAGDFADATWAGWKDDLRRAVGWLLDYGVERVILLGLRLGALLASDTLDALPKRPTRLIFWQPVANAELFLSQFLRIRLAASLTSQSVRRETTSDLRARWLTGKNVEVGGYEVSAQLAGALDDLRLPGLLSADAPPVSWFDLAPQSDKSSPAVQRVLDELHRNGVTVEARVVIGQPFWALQEIEVVPDLLELTCEAITHA
jgi:exosortase A-associated hydrolase 2